MPTSDEKKLEVINNAEILLGLTPSDTLSDDTKSMNNAKKLWDSLRKACLREFPWNFAKVRATLSSGGTMPSPVFNNVFAVDPTSYPTTPYIWFNSTTGLLKIWNGTAVRTFTVAP